MRNNKGPRIANTSVEEQGRVTLSDKWKGESLRQGEKTNATTELSNRSITHGN